MGNAIKFVEKGHVALEVVMESHTSRSFLLHFSISDTGVGMPSEALEHIFDKYSQVSGGSDKKHGGTGLGLSIVKKLVEQQHGAITVHSTLGKGTRFDVRIPYINDKIAPVQPHVPVKEDATATKARLNGTHILVFEDNRLNQRLISEQLEYWGCWVAVTDDPEKGFQILNEKPIQLVLMDLKMPKMSGFAISRKIREGHLG